MKKAQISQPRRKLLMAAAAASASALTASPLSVLAQSSEEIVIGGSIPMTGVFAFAGVGINAGIADFVKMTNDAGGVEGRKLKYVPEDTGYKVDVSVATFKKITSQNKVNLYYGDSTGFSKTINPELARNGNIMMAGASFASELNDPQKYPNQFLVGPDYTEMFGILLRHIAKEKPGAKVAFVYSDSEFGRDPIEKSEAAAKSLGLSVPIKIMTPAGSVEVSTEVIKLRRAAPDYTIFHGYILAPIPEFVTQGKQMGMTTKWMGTFWTMDSSTVMQMGENAEGFMGVMPFRYYYDTEKAPMLEKIRAMRPEYQSTAYIQGFLAAMLFTESARRCLKAGKPLTGHNLKAALNSLENFDTGGLIGVPITIKGNSIPVGRVYRADYKAKKMVAASDWISLSKLGEQVRRITRLHAALTPVAAAATSRFCSTGAAFLAQLDAMQTTSDNVLEINNIEVIYNKVVQALRGLSLSVPRGQIVALLGSNGAGKSTTLKAASGLLELEDGALESGNIRFNGQDISSTAPQQLVHQGLSHVMEGRRVFEDLTVEENLIASTYALSGRANANAPDFDLVYTYFPRLHERRKGLAGYLSGGEQQMLAIGRALIAQPELILLDEPSLGLSPKLVEDIFTIIARINAERGTSMLLVEQNATVALAVAHTGYIMENGKIVINGSAEKLANDPDVREFYLGMGGSGEAKSFKDIKHYKRRKRWLS